MATPMSLDYHLQHLPINPTITTVRVNFKLGPSPVHQFSLVLSSLYNPSNHSPRLEDFGEIKASPFPTGCQPKPIKTAFVLVTFATMHLHYGEAIFRALSTSFLLKIKGRNSSMH